MKGPAFRNVLSPVWLKAAVLGGVWASVEIIIGSFFHNMRLPFAGTILGMNATILMIAFYQVWPEKGLIWRAGLIAALMKSMSPSAIILGPMIGILSEALIVELFIRIFGNNLVSLSVAGALSVSSALLHKVVSLLILYGFNIVTLYLNIFNYLARQLQVGDADPWMLALAVLLAYAAAGILSAALGKVIGRRAAADAVTANLGLQAKMAGRAPEFMEVEARPYSLFLFYLHLLIIPAGLFMMNQLPLARGAALVLLYSIACILIYRQSLRRLKKRVFWFQLLFLTLLASVFWNGFRTGGGDIFGLEGLLVGLEMNLRAVFVVIAFSSFSVELRNPRIRDFLFRKGFDRIYTALGLSFSALPVMMDAMPGPLTFLRRPAYSFSLMVRHAREWLAVFEMKNREAGVEDLKARSAGP